MGNLKIISWNVNGLRAVYKKGFLDWFLTESPDILCLQETKVAEEQVPPELKDVEGYRSYFTSPGRKGYSGAGLYSKVEPETVKAGFGVKRFDAEGRTLTADFGDFVLFNVYFPNGKASAERLEYKLGFYDAFLKHVRALLEEGRNVIVCGDVNTAHKEIDLTRPKENQHVSGFLPEERAWIDEFLASGFIDTFRAFNGEPGQYTWWDYKTRARDRNVGWRLDYFFVSESLRDRVKDAFILSDVMGSDHCPVGIKLAT
jgi:exodeoxyribonuclease-3